MKAVQCSNYGPPEVLQLADIPKPTVGNGDVLVKVHYTTVTAADYRIRGAKFPKGFAVLARLGLGITKPRKSVLGSTFAGEVVEVGDDVTDYVVGDKVCGMTGINMGAYAEYIALPASKAISKVPEGVEMKDIAALLFGGGTAAFFLKNKVSINTGDTVLVNGASGAVGSAIVSIAKHMGAQVTGVCSAKNTEVVMELGADAVIDYTTTPMNEFGQYDYVFDCVGNVKKENYSSLVNSDGTMVLLVSGLLGMLNTLMPTSMLPCKVVTGDAKESKENVQYVVELLQQGVLQPTIDKEYTLDEIVAAHTYADTGRKVGNIVVNMA